MGQVMTLCKVFLCKDEGYIMIKFALLPLHEISFKLLAGFTRKLSKIETTRNNYLKRERIIQIPKQYSY